MSTAPTSEPAGHWAQVPERTVVRRELPATGWPVDLATVLVVVLPIAVYTDGGRGRGWALVVGGLAGLVELVGGRLHSWAGRLAAWTFGGAVLALLNGEVLGAWGAATLLLADWAFRRRPPLPVERLRAGPAAALPVLVLALVAAWILRSDPDDLRAQLLTGVALLITAVSGRWGHLLEAMPRVVGGTAARWVSTVLFGLLGVALVLVPWAVGRSFRLDPLDERVGAGWLPRRRLDLRPAAPWSEEAADLRRTPLQRIRWRMAVPALVAIALLAGVLATRGAGRGVTAALGSRPAAVADAPWWDAYDRELKWAFETPGVAYDPATLQPLADIRGRFINVEGGRRVTWIPPACECRRLRVWIYGGSTVLGWGQRDRHTVPSELARVAWEDGIALDVSNRGIAGDLNWQGSNRFVWDAGEAERPDLVIFYDGSNDLAAATEVNGEPAGFDTRWPIWWNRDRSLTWLARSSFRQWLLGGAPPGVEVVEREPVPRRDADELAAAVVDAYDRGRAGAVALAAARGIPAVWFWQPDRYTRPARADEPRLEAEDERFQRRLHDAARRRLPADVVDVGDLFDGVDEPVYFDDVHTGEAGARMVAERLYREISPLLADPAARSGS